MPRVGGNRLAIGSVACFTMSDLTSLSTFALFISPGRSGIGMPVAFAADNAEKYLFLRSCCSIHCSFVGGPMNPSSVLTFGAAAGSFISWR